MEGLYRRWDVYMLLFVLTLVFHCVSFTVGSVSGMYRDNGVDRTEKVHEMSGRDQREMQHEILTLLGLHHRPKPKGHSTTEYSGSRFMLKLYKNITSESGQAFVDQNDNEFHSNMIHPVDGTDVIMSFVNHVKKAKHLRRKRDKALYFDFSEVTSTESVLHAELRIYKRKAKKWKKHPFSVKICMIRQGHNPDEYELVVEDEVTVKANHEGWLTFNLTHAASMWTTYPTTNLGLYMKIIFIRKDREVDPGKFGIIGRRGKEQLQPFLVGFFKSVQQLHVRKTRAVARRRQQEETYDDEVHKYRFPRRVRRWPCQRRNLYLKFKDLGWQNWIIAPDGFLAYYCDGECSFPLGAPMNATNHAIIQTLVHLLDPKDAPSPGCAPTKLGPQSVLYFDDNSNVVLKKFPNMVVHACGCH